VDFQRLPHIEYVTRTIVAENEHFIFSAHAVFNHHLVSRHDHIGTNVDGSAGIKFRFAVRKLSVMAVILALSPFSSISKKAPRRFQ
jgi:hypothetical protein